jgi:hypothetical protein
MTQQIVLTEHLTYDQANLVESILGEGLDKSYYLAGRLMVAEEKNGNGRRYRLDEMQQVVEKATNKILTEGPIMGELAHPDNLSINLANVSHCITEMRMDANTVVGKMKLLNTPSGNIAKSLLEGGVKLGVSSRGAGSVGNDGVVSGFSFTTVDIVSQPSGPGCYPNLVRESIENQKIVTLAEAMVHDATAQKYLRKEMKKFLHSLVVGK